MMLIVMEEKITNRLLKEKATEIGFRWSNKDLFLMCLLLESKSVVEDEFINLNIRSRSI